MADDDPEASRGQLVVLVVGLAVVLGLFGAGGAGAGAAVPLAFATPVGLCWLAFRTIRRAHRPVAVAGAVLAAIVAVAATVDVRRAVMPAPDQSVVELSTQAKDAAVAVEGTSDEFSVDVAGHVASGSGAMRGDATVVLSRGGQIEKLAAHFSRVAQAAKVGRGQTLGSTSVTHDHDVFRVHLPGSGPIAAHLEATSGGVGSGVTLSVAALPAGTLLLDAVLAVSLLFALAIESVAARELGRMRYSAFVGAAVALALYLPHGFLKSEPLNSLVGGLVVALIAGAGGMRLLSYLVRRFRAQPAGASVAAEKPRRKHT